MYPELNPTGHKDVDDHLSHMAHLYHLRQWYLGMEHEIHASQEMLKKVHSEEATHEDVAAFLEFMDTEHWNYWE